MIASSLAVGTNIGIFDGNAVLQCLACGASLAGLVVASAYFANEERQAPLDETYFEVREVPSMGYGLFALKPIEAGTYIFDYGGEVLDEVALFARYPQGDGLYVAGITDDLYIDGVDPELSNLARWMNHAYAPKANVEKRKQRLGPRKAMHLYASRKIKKGDELRFDYGAEYWQAMGVEPF